MAHSESTTGGCLCGAVRYQIKAPLDDAAHCHCSMCRRASGAVAVTWLTVPFGRFKFTRGKPALYRSSSHAERRFCTRCGAQLTFQSVRAPNVVDVTVGTLDQPERAQPNRHVWRTARLPWLHLDEQLPSFAEASPADKGR